MFAEYLDVMGVGLAGVGMIGTLIVSDILRCRALPSRPLPRLLPAARPAAAAVRYRAKAPPWRAVQYRHRAREGSKRL